MSIKETFLKKYGVAEYIVMLAGLCVIARGVYSFIVLNLRVATWDEIAKVCFVFSLGLLACCAPNKLITWSGKLVGAKTEKKSDCDHPDHNKD